VVLSSIVVLVERKPLTFKKWKEAEVQAVTHEKVKGLIIAGEFIQE